MLILPQKKESKIGSKEPENRQKLQYARGLMEKQLVRVSKLLSERGICSRREADAFIEMGQVVIDGERIATLGQKVSPDVTLSLMGNAKKQQQNKVTILVNKPVGYVSTQPEKGYRAAIELITPQNRYEKETMRLHFSHLRKLSPCGRLDIDSKGLLVFTQDGTFAKKLIGENSGIEKEYLVHVTGSYSEETLKKLTYGMSLDGKPLKRAQVTSIKPGLLRFVLTEGKKRQIRRMCELVGLAVTGLKRVRIGSIMLGDLPEGQWRYLPSGERFT